MSRTDAMNRPKRISLVVALLLLCSVATFMITKHYVYANAYTKGVNAGKEEASQATTKRMDAWSNSPFNPLVQERNKLREDYNALVDDYNKLRVAANALQYQARQPVTCNTNTYFAEYGNITTRCY